MVTNNLQFKGEMREDDSIFDGQIKRRSVDGMKTEFGGGNNRTDNGGVTIATNKNGTIRLGEAAAPSQYK